MAAIHNHEGPAGVKVLLADDDAERAGAVARGLPRVAVRRAHLDLGFHAESAQLLHARLHQRQVGFRAEDDADFGHVLLLEFD